MVVPTRSTIASRLRIGGLRRALARLGEAGNVVRHPAFIATAAAVLVAGIVLAAVLRAGYNRALEAGHARASELSRLVEEQTIRSVQAVDLVLQGMADAVRTFTIPEHDPAFQQVLAKRLQVLPHVRALFVIGADGFITHDSDHPATPRVSLADRDYFKVHESDPSVGLHIGRPLLSRSVRRWFVSVSRRVDRPDGSLGGIVVAAVEPAFYDRFFGELRLAPGDVINLLHADATLIARAPVGSEAVGQRFSALKLFTEHLPRSRSGTYVAVSQVDGLERIVSYRTVMNLPLVVTVALSREAILAGWRASASLSVAAFLLIGGLSLAIAHSIVQRRLERRLARQRAFAAQRLEMLGQMTGGIAHDFNNLITVATTSLFLAERHIDDPARVRKHVRATREALERSANLTARLLAFARHQSPELTVEDANALIRSLEPMLRQAAGSRAALTLDLSDGLPPVLIDHAQFDAALLNLVINARDAMPDGGTITIATTCWFEPDPSPLLKPGSYVRVQVRDTGSGMPPATLRRAFEPLFTTKGSLGTGLGLSQVYGFIRHIGGDARIMSRPGEGTTVELLFPCRPE
jgi:signal transduction histidine kinase